MPSEEAMTDRTPLPGTDLGWIQPHKLSSATARVPLPESVRLLAGCPPKVGDLIAVRVLTDSPNYNLLELTSGRVGRVTPGDVIVGVLGERRALRGFSGGVPATLARGDRLQLLNRGGLIGVCTGYHQPLGRPSDVEVLGLVESRGRIANLRDAAIELEDELRGDAPLILIAGTSMNSGKTGAAISLIKSLTSHGLRVSAAKLSGAAALRDTFDMRDHGAVEALSFLDCGFPSTVGLENLSRLARTLVSRLSDSLPDAIVLELGDGLIGPYEVESIFDDRELLRRKAVLVFCAEDFVGAWGGQQLLRDKNVEIDVVTGSVTDSPAGREYLRTRLGVRAANAQSPDGMFHQIVVERLDRWRSSE